MPATNARPLSGFYIASGRNPEFSFVGETSVKEMLRFHPCKVYPELSRKIFAITFCLENAQEERKAKRKKRVPLVFCKGIRIV